MLIKTNYTSQNLTYSNIFDFKFSALAQEFKIEGDEYHKLKKNFSGAVSSLIDNDEVKRVGFDAGKLAFNSASTIISMDPTIMALSYILNFIIENVASNLTEDKDEKEKKDQEGLEKFQKLFNKIFSKENFDNFVKNADKLFNYLFKKDEKIEEKSVDKFLDFFEKIEIDDNKDKAVSFLNIMSDKFKKEGRNEFAEKFSKLAGKISTDKDLSGINWIKKIESSDAHKTSTKVDLFSSRVLNERMPSHENNGQGR